MNGAAQAILGRRISEVAGTPLDHVLPGWTLSRLTTGSEDLTLTTPGGRRSAPSRRRPSPSTADREGPTGYMVLLHDVTERRAAAATIRESEQRYRQLVENAHDLIFTCDLAGHLRSINRAGLARPATHARRSSGAPSPIWSPPRRGRASCELLQAARDGARAGAGRDRPHRQERPPRAARSGQLAPGHRRSEPDHPGDRARPDRRASATRISSASRRRWRPSASSPPASPTTSTTCSPPSSASPTSPSGRCRPTARRGRRWRRSADPASRPRR